MVTSSSTRRLGSAGAWSAVGTAQTVPVIGYLGAGRPDAARAREVLEAFHGGLSETGYLDGKDVIIEYRWAEDRLDRLPTMASDLVRRQVSVIVTLQSTASALAAKAATSSIPIVFEIGTDPVDAGLVASLARTGGNATGISLMAPEISAKRLDILSILAPGINRFAILWDSSNPGMAQRVRETQIAADRSHVLLHTVGPRNLDELEASFADLLSQHPDALLVTAEPFTQRYLVQILDFANSNRIPAMFESSDYVEAGGLMSYGPDYQETFRMAAVLVGEVLKGAKPADLPIEQPTNFELVLNLKTAKAIGREFPPTLIALANRVIE